MQNRKVEDREPLIEYRLEYYSQDIFYKNSKREAKK